MERASEHHWNGEIPLIDPMRLSALEIHFVRPLWHLCHTRSKASRLPRTATRPLRPNSVRLLGPSSGQLRLENLGERAPYTNVRESQRDRRPATFPDEKGMNYVDKELALSTGRAILEYCNGNNITAPANLTPVSRRCKDSILEGGPRS